VVISAGSDALFQRLCGVLGHPEWATQARFIDNPQRVAHQEALYRLIDPLVAARPTAHWVEALEAAGVPCAPVNTVGQMLEHAQTQALDLVHPVPGTGMRFVALPLAWTVSARVCAAPACAGRPYPAVAFPELA
jgi:crotonobetainyl-CoA:carnitine CoA-transferase CaiB-like acyl-CoA transferase